MKNQIEDNVYNDNLIVFIVILIKKPLLQRLTIFTNKDTSVFRIKFIIKTVDCWITRG